MAQPVPQSLRYLPVGLFGGVMGIEGFGLASREAPAGLLRMASEFWVWTGVAALALLLCAYVAKVVRYPRAAAEEFTDPARMGFCSTLPLALVLCGGGLAAYAAGAAQLAWWTGACLFLGCQLWGIRRVLCGVQLAEVNPGWMIMFIGGIVVPGTGVGLGNVELSRFLFGASTAVAPFVMGAVLYRIVLGPPLPPPMRPTWFILLVPPGFIYANGQLLSNEPAGVFLNGCFFAGLLLMVGLFMASVRLRAWPFGVAWWAFTFPLVGIGVAASRYARSQPTLLWVAIADAVLVAALAFIVVVGVRTILACLNGSLLAAPGAVTGPAPP